MLGKPGNCFFFVLCGCRGERGFCTVGRRAYRDTITVSRDKVRRKLCDVTVFCSLLTNSASTIEQAAETARSCKSSGSSTDGPYYSGWQRSCPPGTGTRGSGVFAASPRRWRMQPSLQDTLGAPDFMVSRSTTCVRQLSFVSPSSDLCSRSIRFTCGSWSLYGKPNRDGTGKT